MDATLLWYLAAALLIIVGIGATVLVLEAVFLVLVDADAGRQGDVGITESRVPLDAGLHALGVVVAVVGGIVTKEWITAKPNAKNALYIGLAAMIIGVVIIAIGNSLS